ncbi:MAG: anion permease, partial [Pyramidobacter sp.]|nr:anion permease [Pyramidobacter sp.]
KPARYTPKEEKVIVTIFFLNVILMVVASMTKIIAPYLVSLFFAAVIMGKGYLTEKEAFQSISWQTVFLVAGTLPLATAINVSGTSKWMVGLVQQMFPSMTNPVVLATAFAVISMIVTQFMSNLAVWAVFGPIAASMAVSLGMDPRLVLAGVGVGSIICFATPMAAPAPAYAYSAAGFTMKEYIKMGWFPCVLMTVVFVLWAPLVLNWLY